MSFQSFALVLFISFLPLQGKKKAEVCPWCKNDPVVLAAAGAVSHGPIAIGPKGSEELANSLPGCPWIFLETKHIRWATYLGPQVVTTRDRARVEAELARLRKVLPSVPLKADKLDPYLRLHLLAMRGEEFYTRFQKLLRVTDESFPEASKSSTEMGIGKYFGEREKFEIVIHGERWTHTSFTKNTTGVQVNDSLRWHYTDTHKLFVSVPALGGLKEDRELFPYIVHNLSHLFLCAYKHFSYDPPIWLDEGLAHAMEREIDPESNTFDGEEGAIPVHEGSPDWTAATKKIIAANGARSLAEMIHHNGFGQLGKQDHIVVWSKARFLIDAHGDKLAQFLAAIKGQRDENGIPSGKDIQGLQRKHLKEIWGWSSEGFDASWRTWANQQQ